MRGVALYRERALLCPPNRKERIVVENPRAISDEEFERDLQKMRRKRGVGCILGGVCFIIISCLPFVIGSILFLIAGIGLIIFGTMMALGIVKEKQKESFL
jgi:hypothetical protein